MRNMWDKMGQMTGPINKETAIVISRAPRGLPKRTIRDKLIGGFRLLGAVRVNSRLTKYVVYRYHNRNYYIGASGALRVGKTIAASIPSSPRFVKHVVSQDDWDV